MLKRAMGIVLLLSLFVLAVTPVVAKAARVIDDNDPVVLHGNVHPHARPDADMGFTDPSLPMERMVLALRLAPGKQAELDQVNADLQDSASPSYHRWLTAAEFGDRFGPSADDIATITGWLTSHGFMVEEVANGRLWINFTGTVEQVNRTFRTSIHDYHVEGRVYHANAVDPSIPRGLADSGCRADRPPQLPPQTNEQRPTVVYAQWHPAGVQCWHLPLPLPHRLRHHLQCQRTL